jgi:hypothetical protein
MKLSQSADQLISRLRLDACHEVLAADGASSAQTQLATRPGPLIGTAASTFNLNLGTEPTLSRAKTPTLPELSDVEIHDRPVEEGPELGHLLRRDVKLTDSPGFDTFHSRLGSGTISPRAMPATPTAVGTITGAASGRRIHGRSPRGGPTHQICPFVLASRLA